MVSRAGKDFLRNTIRSTDYHNKLIEEQEMWKQWETQKGLTMMVTDDYLRRRMRMDEYPGPSRKKRNGCDFDRQSSRSGETSGNNPWTRKLMETEEQETERWGHSGYKELYPEEFANRDSSIESETDAEKIEAKLKVEKTQKRKRKRHKKHKKKAKKTKTSCDTDSETEELRRDIRNIQRQKRGLPLIKKKKKKKEYSSSDSDVKIIGVSAPRLPLKRSENDSTKVSDKDHKT